MAVKSKVKISQNFVAFSDHMIFKLVCCNKENQKSCMIFYVENLLLTTHLKVNESQVKNFFSKISFSFTDLKKKLPLPRDPCPENYTTDVMLVTYITK